MIRYTLKDVNFLAKILISHLCIGKDTDSELSETWFELLERSKKDYKGNIKEIILEFFGNYFLAANRTACKKSGITDLIFKAPAKEMPLYISSKGAEKIIAQWRLVIGK